MASIHDVRIPNDHKTDIIEMMMEKKAVKTSFVTNAIREAQETVACTHAQIRNRVERNLTLLNNRNYSGSPIDPYPSVLEKIPTLTQGFVHKAQIISSPEGSKGCVVYSGYNHDAVGKEECAWLLAWHTPFNGSECKVYVECGRRVVYQPDILDWDAIEQKLDRSSTKCYFKDQNTGCEASAQIEFDGEIADLANLVAAFRVTN